jgi:quinol monooxygenase YgiN
MNKLYLLASVTLLLASISASGARAKTADSVTVITYIDSIPDQFIPNNEEKARALVKQMNADTQHDPGLISYIILRETDHPNHFTILEVWKDDAAFNAHELAAHTRKFRNDLQPLIGSPYNILITKIFE